MDKKRVIGIVGPTASGKTALSLRVAKALQGDYERISQEMNRLYYIGFSEKEIRQFEGYLLRILDNLEGGANHE